MNIETAARALAYVKGFKSSWEVARSFNSSGVHSVSVFFERGWVHYAGIITKSQEDSERTCIEMLMSDVKKLRKPYDAELDKILGGG